MYKCSLCGGFIQPNADGITGECEYCGAKGLLPKDHSEEMQNLLNLANEHRRACDFDKAISEYEKALLLSSREPEAHWGLLLSKYGVEYVQDKKTLAYATDKLTLHRLSSVSVFDDADYVQTIENADFYAASSYREKAEEIEAVLKATLIEVRKQPYDVFLSYKEKDENTGARTEDSSFTYDVYNELTAKGYKVFFSRSSIGGEVYEPKIYAALVTAHTMIVIGSKAEYFTAVWVKNEWKRFLEMIDRGDEKQIIPVFRSKSPDILPVDLQQQNALQASGDRLIEFFPRLFDMLESFSGRRSRITAETNQSAGSTLLERGFLALEDGDWAKADGFFEQALNVDAKNAQAYLGKLMAELQIHRQEDLAGCERPFEDNKNYQKAIRFGDNQLRTALDGYNARIRERNENARLLRIYNDAFAAVRPGTEEAFKEAARKFQSLSGFMDADVQAKVCLRKAEEARKNAIYDYAKSQMKDNTVYDCETAIKYFSRIPGWKDADEQIRVCRRKIEQIKAAEDAAAKRGTAITAVIMAVVIACIVFIIVLVTVIIPKQKLNQAMGFLDSGNYEAAYTILEKIGKRDVVVASKEERANELLDSGNYGAAYTLLEEIGKRDVVVASKEERANELLDSGNYEAAYTLLEEIGKEDVIASSKYERAVALIDSGDIETAYILLNGLEYNDSAYILSTIKQQYFEILLSKAQVDSCVFFGTYEQDNNLSNGKEDIEWIVLARNGNKALLISKYALDCHNYTELSPFYAFANADWKVSPLRDWLNGTFLEAAFDSKQQNRIITSYVTNNTADKVSLLSKEEANTYFSSDSLRQCQGTEYCYAQGVKKAQNGCCSWWLRYHGGEALDVSIVDSDGSFSSRTVSNSKITVRPVIWLNLGY